MKRSLYALAASVVLAVTVSAATAQAADVGFSIRIGDRYRGNSLYFRSEPQTYMIPETRVYYVRNRDLDMYRYGSYWYYIEDGYWYRATSWRGPFYRVRMYSVPRPIMTIPVRYRRHWRQNNMAEGYYRNGRYWNWNDHERDRYGRSRDYDRNNDNDRDYNWRDRDRDRDGDVDQNDRNYDDNYGRN